MLTVGSLFAGIGGFDLGLERTGGFRVIWQVENNPFCQRVLASRFPHAARWADAREFTPDRHESAVDCLVGGFPCQDLSVAGKRAGLAGERSGLFWEIVRIAKELRPPFLLLENVPGLLSSNDGKDIGIVLDALYELGYIVEVDECDSQYFGVAQRRRRLFFCGIDALHGLLNRTHSSSAMRCSFLAQSLLDALESLSRPSPTDASDSDSSDGIAERGLLRKIRCCEASLGESAWRNWLSDCTGQLQRSATEPNGSDSPLGENGSLDALDTDALSREALFVGSISKSWLELWADLSESPKASTISTWTRRTTDRKICICAELSLSILRHIAASKPSSPFSLNAVSSALTAVLAAISSAERIAHDLFAEATWRDRAWLFLEQATCELDAFEQCFTVAGVEAVLFEPEGRHGDSAPSGEAGAHVAASLRSRSATLGINPPGRGGEDDVNLVLSRTVTSREGLRHDESAETHIIMATLNSGGNSGGFRTEPGEHLVTHSLSADGFDASEDGTGRGTPLIPIGEIGCRTNGDGYRDGDMIGKAGDPMFTLQAGKQRAIGVRRLTPTECERLQGFPDGWTCLCQPLTDYDPMRCACADSPRYRALGNAVTVPVIEWLGRQLLAAREEEL